MDYTKKKQAKQMLSDPFCTKSIEEIAKILSVTENTVKKWLCNPEFIEEAFSQYHLYSQSQLLQVLKVLNSLCAKGDLRAIKLFFELREKVEGKQNAVVNIIDDIPK